MRKRIKDKLTRRVRQKKTEIDGRVFVLSAMAATLYHSGRVLGKTVTGSLDLAATENVIEDWTKGLFDRGDITLSADGLHHLAPGQQSYVMMSNHQSLADVPCLIRAYPAPIRCVAKSELGRVPIFGEALRQGGNVMIDRGDKHRAIEQLKEAKDVLDSGVSLWVAPEGTRSKTGELLPFKKGGFHVAIDLGAPIAPIYIHGTREILETKTLRGRKGIHAHVGFGPPIQTNGLTKDDLPDLMTRTREAILSLKADGEHKA